MVLPASQLEGVADRRLCGAKGIHFMTMSFTIDDDGKVTTSLGDITESLPSPVMNTLYLLQKSKSA